MREVTMNDSPILHLKTDAISLIAGPRKRICERMIRLLGKGVCAMDPNYLRSRYGYLPQPEEISGFLNSAVYIIAVTARSLRQVSFLGEIYEYPEIFDAVEIAAIKDSSLPIEIAKNPIVWNAMKTLVTEARRRASRIIVRVEPRNTSAIQTISAMGFVPTENEDEWIWFVHGDRPLSPLQVRLLLNEC